MDAGAQARQVFENVKAILEAASTSMDRVVKTTIFLADVNDFAAVNAVYAEYFTSSQPARRSPWRLAGRRRKAPGGRHREG